MRHISRMLMGLILAGGLIAVPAVGAMHAAPAAGKSVVIMNDGKGGGQATQIPVLGIDQVASVEGVTTAVLQQDLAAGETLLQIAGSKYASASDLATALLAPVKTKLDKGVSQGKLTADQENQIYTTLLTKVETLVVTPHPYLASGKGQGSGAKVRGPLDDINSTLLTTLATACDTSTTAFDTAIQAGGRSVLAICQATNPSMTQTNLVSTLMAAIKTQLDAAVTAGKLTADQETTLLGNVQTKLTNWVTTPLTAGGAASKA